MYKPQLGEDVWGNRTPASRLPHGRRPVADGARAGRVHVAVMAALLIRAACVRQQPQHHQLGAAYEHGTRVRHSAARKGLGTVGERGGGAAAT